MVAAFPDVLGHTLLIVSTDLLSVRAMRGEAYRLVPATASFRLRPPAALKLGASAMTVAVSLGAAAAMSSASMSAARLGLSGSCDRQRRNACCEKQLFHDESPCLTRFNGR
jgi:hypothetical protein